MANQGRGWIRGTALIIWGFAVLALFLIEHPALFTVSLHADKAPIVSGFDAARAGGSLLAFVIASLLFAWCGLLGRSLAGRSRRTADGEIDAESVLPGDCLLGAAISIGIGLCCLALLTLGFAAFGLLGAPFVATLGASAILLAFHNRDLLGGFPSIGPPRRALDWFALLLIAVAIAAATVMHLSPLMSTDALVYHMQIPRLYVEAGRLVRVPYNVYANMPHAGEMLYTAGYLLGGEGPAKCIDLGFRIVLLCALAGFARRWLGVRHALLAPCVFLMNPLVLDNRTVANIDVAMALVFLLAVVEMLRWEETGRARHVLVASVFAGTLAGMKYTGGLFAAALFVTFLIFAAARGRERAPAWHLLLLPFPALAFFLPWLLKNILMTGNPIYPLMPERFGGIEWNAELGSQLVSWQASMGMGRSVADTIALPWNMTVRANLWYENFDGILSPLYLMWIPAAALWRPIPTAGRRLALLSLLALCVWAWGPQQLRFFMPALPLLSLLVAWVLDRAASGLLPRLASLLALLMSFAYFVLFTLHIAAVTLPNQTPAALGLETREDYLLRWPPLPYEAMERANRELPENAKLVLLWENRAYYLDRPYVADSFYEASWIMQLIAQDPSGALFEQRLRDEGVTHILMNTDLGKIFGRHYNPRLREALDRFVRERAKILHFSERNGFLIAEFTGLPQREATGRGKRG
jgi:hypothetical protein